MPCAIFGAANESDVGFEDLSRGLSRDAAQYFGNDPGVAVRFEGLVRLGVNNERRFEAVVYVSEGDSEPYRILAWDANRPRACALCRDEVAFVQRGIRETFRWLADGLVQAWTDIEERLRPRHRLQFVRTGEGYVLQRPTANAWPRACRSRTHRPTFLQCQHAGQR